MNPDGSTKTEAKGYEFEKFMISLSAKYRSTVFKLYGEGEESGDIWAEFYHDGKRVHEIRLQRELPEPDLDVIAPVIERELEFDPGLAGEVMLDLYQHLNRALDFIMNSPAYHMGNTLAHEIVDEGNILLDQCRS